MTVSFVTLGIDVSYQIFRNLTFPLTATSDCSGDLGDFPWHTGLGQRDFCTFKSRNSIIYGNNYLISLVEESASELNR